MSETLEQLPRGVSIVVPAYNSEGTLRELIETLERILGETEEAFEFILVDDCSRDRTWEIIQKLAAERDNLQGVTLMRNYGQHNALLCGIRLARFDVTVTMDDDLQNPPEEVPALLAELRKGFDVVYGRPDRRRHGLYRNLASKITKIVLKKAMGAQTAGNTSAFRAFRTDLREAFRNYSSPLVAIDVLLTWATTRFTAIEVRHVERKVGKSNYSLGRLVILAFTMMTGFSTLPLRMATAVGFSFALFGIVVLGYVVCRYLIQGTTVPGFPFLASVIAIFSGATLFALGIMGEYLGRMHMRLMDQPTYVLRDRTGVQGPSPRGNPDELSV